MEYSAEMGQLPVGIMILYGVVGVLMIVSMRKIFVKAGRKGRESLIPFYNNYVMVKIVEKPMRWFWGLFVPGMNLVVAFLRVFVFPFKLAEKFGKSSGFGVGLLLLSVVFLPMLAFGDAEYKKSTAKEVITA